MTGDVWDSTSVRRILLYVACASVVAVGLLVAAASVQASHDSGSGATLPSIDGAVPADLNDDGRHRDLNANGRLDSDDVVTYFEHMDAAAVRDHVTAYDYNGNERIDFDDVVTLFEALGSPTARFSPSAAEVTTGETVTFDATASSVGDGGTYEWSLGDGTTATGETVTHAYAGTGAYEVSLTVSDADGTDTATRTIQVVADGGTADRRVVAYYTSWARYERGYMPADVPLDSVTHLNYAFLDVHADGTVVRGDEWGDEQNLGAFENLTAEHPDTTFLLSIGGWTYSENFSDAAATPERRQRFASSAVEHMRASNFSGIDVDWEYPGGGGHPDNVVRPDDERNFTLLLEAVREELDAAEREDGREYELTIAVSADPAKVERLEVEAVGDLVDGINVMTYDYHGSWSDRTNHNAPLYAPLDDPAGGTGPSVAGTMEFWANQPVDRSTVTVGLPFYGRGFAGVPSDNDGLYQPFTGTPDGTYGSASLYEFWDVNQNLNASSSTYEYHWHDEAMVPYVYSSEDEVFVSFDDERSIRLKTAYARENEWGGVMIWALSHDRNGVLLDAVNDELHGESG